jgi:hypothetical protein
VVCSTIGEDILPGIQKNHIQIQLKTNTETDNCQKNKMWKDGPGMQAIFYQLLSGWL